MIEQTVGTMDRLSKGPLAPPPLLPGLAGTVAQTVASWPGVVATAHWHLYHPEQVDGIDFYVGGNELGHIHLDQTIHLATNPALGKALVSEGLARRFPYARGWVEEQIARIGAPAAVALFKRNYQRFVPATGTA